MLLRLGKFRLMLSSNRLPKRLLMNFGPKTNAIDFPMMCCSQVVGSSSAHRTSFLRRRNTSSLSRNHLQEERLLWSLT